MRRVLILALLVTAVAPATAAADLRVASTVAFTRPDGTAVPFAMSLHVWCGRWDSDARERTLHVRAGITGENVWHLRAVVADVRRQPTVRFPHSFNFDEPSGAQLFAVDGTNELSSAEEEASGRISFSRVRCGRRLAVRFRVRAVLGSEVSGDPLTVRGSFRASKTTSGLARKFAHVCGVRSRLLLRGMQARARRRRLRLRLVPSGRELRVAGDARIWAERGAHRYRPLEVSAGAATSSLLPARGHPRQRRAPPPAARAMSVPA